MKLSNCIEGLTILRRYFNGEDGCHLGAEHDTLYVSPTDAPVGVADLARLKELGWRQENVEDGGPYDPEEFWRASV